MRTMNRKVVFSPPDTNNHKMIQSFSSCGAKVGGGCCKKRVTMNMTRNHPKSSSPSSSKEFSISALRFLKRVGAKMAKALSFVSSGKKRSRKVSSSAGPGLARSWSYAESSTLDSQRAEAIEDCIEFLNSSSSSSLQRSFSATSCSSR